MTRQRTFTVLAAVLAVSLVAAAYKVMDAWAELAEMDR